ncbi:DUF732 domain-containing protein [Nocardia thailandica]|uniref:DUF732 domain-containing protein n=1 Tax=Nocardia thailandica TaxID=257275 RepID=UPI0002D5C75B|nr:DUF732 domain-containing protein [Nocardia thailandica]
MHRIPAKVAGSVAALAAVALLSACGGNDSTASTTPTLSSTAAASSASAAPSSSAAPHGDHTTTAAPETSAPETPQTVQPQQTPAAVPVTDKGKAFLAELEKQGIKPGSPDIAITAADYICTSRATGASDADIAPFVAAMAGSDPSFDQSKMDVDKAAKAYIDAATATYCK